MTFAMIYPDLFDSSLMDCDPMTRLVFLNMVVLSNPYTGVLEMTLRALARRMHLDDDAVAHALKILETPDPDSRTKEHEGKRILATETGWIVVNRAKYSRRKKRTPDEIREQTLARVTRHREKEKSGDGQGAR